MKTINLFKISEVLASLFSILFSMSLIKELKAVGSEWYVFYTATCFLILFVIFIEVMKVRELKKKFRGEQNSLMFLIFTFTISLGLSVLGVWLWTDKTYELSEQNLKAKQEQVNTISSTYSQKIDSIQSIDITASIQYKDLKKARLYYQYIRTEDEVEKQVNRKKVAELSDAINDLNLSSAKSKQESISLMKERMNIAIEQVNESYNGNKEKESRNNTISWIFFIIVAITEFIIVIIQKEQANPDINRINEESKLMVNTVTYLSLKNKKGKFDINDFKYSPFIKGIEDWDRVKKLYNLLLEVGITTMSIDGSVFEENPVDRVKAYYKTIKSLY